MRKKRFSVKQMIGVLKQAEFEVIREAGISEQTFIARRRSTQGWK